MSKKFKPYTQKKRERFNKSFKKKKETSTITILNLIISTFTLVASSFIGISTYKFNNLNSHPAFEFNVSEDKKNFNGQIYTLKKSKGEMNNVNFLVYEVITGNGTYNNEFFQIQQSLRFTQNEDLTEFQASYPKGFNTENTKEKINALLKAEKINASIDFLHIRRFYDVSYMNFEHEFKHEYYTIGKNGVGQSIQSPYGNTYQNNDILKFNGGFSGKYDDKIDDNWLANKLFDILKNPLPYQK